MNRRSFFGGLAGAFAAAVAPVPVSARPQFQMLGGGATGITHVFMGPTGEADYRLIGNIHRSASHRGQSCMSPETLGWMRRHHGIVLTPVMERDKYALPDEYVQWLDSCGTWRGHK